MPLPLVPYSSTWLLPPYAPVPELLDQGHAGNFSPLLGPAPQRVLHLEACLGSFLTSRAAQFINLGGREAGGGLGGQLGAKAGSAYVLN